MASEDFAPSAPLVIIWVHPFNNNGIFKKQMLLLFAVFIPGFAHNQHLAMSILYSCTLYSLHAPKHSQQPHYTVHLSVSVLPFWAPASFPRFILSFSPLLPVGRCRELVWARGGRVCAGIHLPTTTVPAALLTRQVCSIWNKRLKFNCQNQNFVCGI